MLRGHSGPITSIAFNHNDTILVSCSIDGWVYEWAAESGKRNVDTYQAKDVCFTSAIMDHENRIVVCGQDRSLRCIKSDDKGLDGVYPIVNKLDVNILQIAMSHSQKYLFCGDENGYVHCFTYPFLTPDEGCKVAVLKCWGP